MILPIRGVEESCGIYQFGLLLPHYQPNRKYALHWDTVARSNLHEVCWHLRWRCIQGRLYGRHVWRVGLRLFRLVLCLPSVNFRGGFINDSMLSYR